MLERGCEDGLSNTPGNRARNKIADSITQIKARTQNFYPSILVLCDLQYGCGQITGHVDPYNIRVAMYGLEQIHVTAPRDHSVAPYATGMSYGPKRKMTEDSNTSISAIGVLFTPSANEIRLRVYHNRYAAIPLEPVLLEKYGINQYRLENEVSGNTAKWKELQFFSYS